MKQHVRSTLLALLTAFVAVCLASPTFAADKMGKHKPQHNVATIWIFYPKDGHFQDFKAGLKKFLTWYKSEGGPFRWQVYSPVTGSDLGYYAVYSGNHAWADIDSENAWSEKNGVDKQFRQDVSPHMRKVGHTFTVTDEKLTHWINDDGYRYFSVYNYQIKPEDFADVQKVLKKVHEAVTRQKWPNSYAVRRNIGGSGGISIVVPMKNLAGMAERSPSLMEVMTKAMGSKKAAQDLFRNFDKAIKDRHLTIYRYVPELSSP